MTPANQSLLKCRLNGADLADYLINSTIWGGSCSDRRSSKNEGCVGSSSRNGTCYTPCGGTTSENCTYLVQAGISMPTADQCTFTICKSSSNICRIKLDFTTFSIAGPTVGTASTLGNTNGGSIGDCTEDSFSLTSPGNIGSPLICGVNTGQHMIVDSSDICHRASFDFSGTTFMAYKICYNDEKYPLSKFVFIRLQYIQFVCSFQHMFFVLVTHLSNQCYTMCFRQEVGKCAICYNTVILGAADMAIDQGSFGLSISSAAIAIATLDTACSEDYLQPFRVVFKTDSDEVLGDGSDDAEMSEQAMAPAGIVGFYLNYALQDC
ncbi:hypothetical protein TCAL_16302 [Tigriopus californicus]|uniref:CUB domain-containing protein n=1 Tax=Tigriopus californicus TaxID=6832 RepID=A0A553N8L5_TIGCA|nr:hypothetical protein TCAL_16302 [Tigriopus californicus]